MREDIVKPLVSVLIPAYNHRFFQRCLSSALGQTYSNLEVIVCDDSLHNRIRDIADHLDSNRLRYIYNRENLGFSGNFTKCFHAAAGDYIKFLNDDDLLHNSCIERMMQAITDHGQDISMVFSKRMMINENDEPLHDNAVTARLYPDDRHLEGRDLGNKLLFHSANFIGEPSTVLFRKSMLQTNQENIFLLNGNDYHCLADVSLWLRLLAAGDAVYLCDELSAFRVHGEQEQYKPEVAVKCLTERYTLLNDGKSIGFLADRDVYTGAAGNVLSIIGSAIDTGQFPEQYTAELAGIRSALEQTVSSR